MSLPLLDYKGVQGKLQKLPYPSLPLKMSR